MAKETRSIRKQVLPNGLTVITEQMSHIRSVAIGIWLKTGSRDEDSEWNGISHFIEHMVFKGTETAPPKPSPAKSTPSAATWTPSPPRSASASTLKC